LLEKDDILGKKKILRMLSSLVLAEMSHLFSGHKPHTFFSANSFATLVDTNLIKVQTQGFGDPIASTAFRDGREERPIGGRVTWTALQGTAQGRRLLKCGKCYP
jgi:hypothetical protein